jgi:mono/diheme cytochrome c family protein
MSFMRNTVLLIGVGIAMLTIPASGALAQDSDTAAGVSGESDFRMYCASCHGEDGKGDGPKSFGLSKPTPDLTMLMARSGGTFPAERLRRVIDGREIYQSHMEREMPVWGQWFKLEAAQELGGAEGDEGTVNRRITNLVDFIESIQTQE